jgi:8-amino-7-oxononanoate synthase
MTDGASTKNPDISYRDINAVKDLREMGLYPYFREISAVRDNMVTIDGKELLMMGSNSYLGLTDHPEVKRAAVAAVEKYGTSCSGSRFLNGSLDIHRALEEELAEFVGKPDALIFSTGFHANSGTISVLVAKGDFAITDKLDHASIIDGCLLSRGKKLRFRHNDMEDLEEVLRRTPFDRSKLVIVDGVFSMEGDIARLPEIVRLCRRYNAEVMVDDAHGIGVLGNNGAGTADHFGLTDDVKIIMGTFSKSLASLGGFIAADKGTIDLLRHTSRTLIFSASTTPSNVAAARAALKIMKREPERIERLWENTHRMMAGLQALGLDTGLSETPIIAVRVGDTMTTFRMCTLLHDEGVFVNPVVAPAVPEGDCLIRISLMASHTAEQINFTLDKMEKVGKSLNVI